MRLTSSESCFSISSMVYTLPIPAATPAVTGAVGGGTIPAATAPGVSTVVVTGSEFTAGLACFNPRHPTSQVSPIAVYQPPDQPPNQRRSRSLASVAKTLLWSSVRIHFVYTSNTQQENVLHKRCKRYIRDII
eukprot:5267964-Pyramimonas_sp.AAC.1